MKKFFMFFALILLPVCVLFGQEPTTPPATWGDVLSNPALWLGSFAGVALLTAFITAFLNGLLGVTKSLIKQLIAWAVAIVIIVGTDLANLGYAKDFPILLAVLHGFGAGLASNGVFDIPLMKAILNSIDGWFKPKPIE